MRETSQPRRELGRVRSFKMEFIPWDSWEGRPGGEAGRGVLGAAGESRDLHLGGAPWRYSLLTSP